MRSHRSVNYIARGLCLRDVSTWFFLVALVAFPVFLAGCGSSTGGAVQQKTTPAITWPAPAAIAYGTALSSTQLDATASVAGTFTYTPAAGTVLTAATQTLNVSFTPNDTNDYNDANASVSIVVNPAQPSITTLPTASAITSGQALSASTLSGGAATVGSATIQGNFAWTAPSTVPAVGTDSESVTFTPTDTTDYISVTADVSIVVNPAVPQITDVTIGGEPAYMTQDEYSNAFPQIVITCAGCEEGDITLESNASESAEEGTTSSTLPGTATTYYENIFFNSGDYEPWWYSIEVKHPGGEYGNKYSFPFLGIGNQSTLGIGPTGEAFQIQQDDGEIFTRASDGTTGTFFPTCTSLLCTYSVQQLAVDDSTGNVIVLHTGGTNEEKVPNVAVYTPAGVPVCSATLAGMTYASGVAAKGGYMTVADPTENLVGIVKVSDCSGYKTVPVAGQPFAVAMANGAELDAYVVSRDKCANGVPCLNKLAIPSETIEGTVDLTGITPVSTIRATTPYEGVYGVVAFSLSNQAAVNFMSDATDGTVLIVNTNTSGGAKMSIAQTVSVPNYPIMIAAQESKNATTGAVTSTVWVNYLLGDGTDTTHIGAIDPTTGNYTPNVGQCAETLIGGFAADANGVHCAGDGTIAAPLVLQP